MTHLPAAAIFLLGSTLSAWLRFDRGALLTGWIVMLVCIAGVMMTWWLAARRAPPLVLPSEVEELGARDQLTPDEEQRFGDALRAHHRHMQRDAWRDLQRRGPAALIVPRAALYYFWLCVIVLAILPPSAVPGDVLPRVPRFVLVLTSLALAAMAVAVPLGWRDWRRVMRALLVVLAVALPGVRSTEAQGLGYAIAGPAGLSGFFGSSASAVHAAGGGEALVNGRAGVGGEFGAFANSSSALLVFSVNGVLHVSPSTASRGLSPFVTGGYTHMGSGEGSFGAWNVGGGIDLWTKDFVGLRVEFRDHVRPDVRGAVQYWTIRAGVVFR